MRPPNALDSVVCWFSTEARGQTHSSSLGPEEGDHGLYPSPPAFSHEKAGRSHSSHARVCSWRPGRGHHSLCELLQPVLLSATQCGPPPQGPALHVRVRAVPMGSAWREGPLRTPGARLPSGCHDPCADCTWPPSGQWSSWQCLCTLRQQLIYGGPAVDQPEL